MPSSASKPLLGILVLGLVAYAASLGWRDRAPSVAELTEIALNGPSLDERVAATVELTRRGPDALDALRRVTAESEDEDVVAASLSGLARQWDYEAMPTLLRLVESNSPLVRGRAAQAVMRMTGRQRPFSANDSVSERGLVAQRLREDWEAISAAPEEHRLELIRRLKESHGDDTEDD